MVTYPNLISEIAKRGIKKKTIAESIGVCDKSLSNKLSGRVPFTWPEVSKIREQFFPDMSSDDLFSRSDDQGTYENRECCYTPGPPVT